MNLADLRLSYTKSGLLESEVDADPIVQFGIWFEQARAAKLPEPNAMALATVGADGTPSARIVLLKGVSDAGFVFYSNYESRKGVEMASKNRASLLFYWAEFERQIRIVGDVGKVSEEESRVYYDSRPRGHCLGAWASAQSSVVAGRETLESALEDVSRRFENVPVPRPPHWGGYRVLPESIEFWQGRPNRLHDRLEYVRSAAGWTTRRLAP